MQLSVKEREVADVISSIEHKKRVLEESNTQLIEINSSIEDLKDSNGELVRVDREYDKKIQKNKENLKLLNEDK